MKRVGVKGAIVLRPTPFGGGARRMRPYERGHLAGEEKHMKRRERLVWLWKHGWTSLKRQSYNWEYKEIHPCTDYLASPRLGPYCLSLIHKLTPTGSERSLSMFAKVVDGARLTFYHPTMNGHLALALHEQFLASKDPAARGAFLSKSRELLENGVRRGEALVWPYPASVGDGEEREWLSAMGQGHAIAALARAYEESGDTAFLDGAIGAFAPFRLSIAEGGVVADRTDFGTFYEEYAYRRPDRQFHTLNGMMSALMGLFDLWKISGRMDVDGALRAGIQSVRLHVGKYDFPFCSSYDLRHLVAREVPLFYAHYNAVHVAQLKVMAVISADAHFEKVSDAWAQKLRDPGNRRQLRSAYLRRRFVDLTSEWL